MDKLQDLNIRFSVRDDLPSERREDYRQLVIKALNFYLNNVGETIRMSEVLMIDRMLNDHDTDPEAIALYELRRSLTASLESTSEGSLDWDLMQAQLQVVNDRIAKL